MAHPIGQDAVVVDPGIYSMTPLGCGQLALSSTAALLSTVTGGIPTGARLALITMETADARWRDDGTAPTTAIGMLMKANSWPPLAYNGDLTAIQFIAVSGSPVLNVAFYD